MTSRTDSGGCAILFVHVFTFALFRFMLRRPSALPVPAARPGSHGPSSPGPYLNNAHSRSADPRQGIADQQVDDPGPAERGLEPDHAGGVVRDVADDRRLLTERVRAQRVQRPAGVGIVDDGDEAPLACHVHGVDPEELSGTADL